MYSVLADKRQFIRNVRKNLLAILVDLRATLVVVGLPLRSKTVKDVHFIRSLATLCWKTRRKHMRSFMKCVLAVTIVFAEAPYTFIRARGWAVHAVWAGFNLEVFNNVVVLDCSEV